MGNSLKPDAQGFDSRESRPPACCNPAPQVDPEVIGLRPIFHRLADDDALDLREIPAPSLIVLTQRTRAHRRTILIRFALPPPISTNKRSQLTSSSWLHRAMSVDSWDLAVYCRP